MNVIGTALEELYRIFGILNRDKFNGELTEPVITIQKTKGRTLGHFTLSKVWKDKNNEESEENAYYEINVDPRWFNSRTPADVAETLLHEMCHYYNKVNDIKDCSGNVHNKKFKSSAEEVGLIVEKGKGVGYGYTSMSEALRAYTFIFCPFLTLGFLRVGGECCPGRPSSAQPHAHEGVTPTLTMFPCHPL